MVRTEPRQGLGRLQDWKALRSAKRGEESGLPSLPPHHGPVQQRGKKENWTCEDQVELGQEEGSE